MVGSHPHQGLRRRRKSNPEVDQSSEIRRILGRRGAGCIMKFLAQPYIFMLVLFCAIIFF